MVMFKEMAPSCSIIAKKLDSASDPALRRRLNLHVSHQRDWRDVELLPVRSVTPDGRH